ncbi:MAG: hypothetical protein HQ555_09970 [Candidatus Aminicenantes bacterium]|nr:hypothetical protein [Candidatus Aminicenantes bacterium]
MKWNFTPNEVMKEEVDYGLEEFLRDLLEETKSKISKKDFSDLPEGKKKNRKFNKAIRDVFNFLYEVYYLAAIKKQRLRDILKHSNEEDRKIIKKILEENKDNSDMLHSILMKRIERELNKGLTKKQALKSVGEQSKKLISKWKI